MITTEMKYLYKDKNVIDLMDIDEAYKTAINIATSKDEEK